MVTSVTRPKGFLFFTAISPSPGNPQHLTFCRVFSVREFSEAPAEHAKMGAATRIETMLGTFYVTESIEEIADKVAIAEKEGS